MAQLTIEPLLNVGDDFFTLISTKIEKLVVTKVETTTTGTSPNVTVIKYTATHEQRVLVFLQDVVSTTAQGAADILVSKYEEENPSINT